MINFVPIEGGGNVTFGGGDGRITGKGTIRTPKLDFENVYYVKELQHFNLFSVSQICDTKNKVFFSEDECLVLSKDFKLPEDTSILLRVPRNNNLYTFNMNDVQPEGDLTCLVAKASLDESTKWHRRMAHVNFKTIKKLSKLGLVQGLPSKVFTNEHNCVACNKRKQHRASYKAITVVSTISEPLQLLHMDLFGPTQVRSIDHKFFCLVITDDYSRFCWVFFMKTKDETSQILKEFVTLVENQLSKKVKGIRCDNGTEFKNDVLIELCKSKGIQRDYSNPRTPQQNEVAERKNRTLIEAARSMLADSKLPTMFWTEAVSTACYVLNRVSITRPHFTTPYELLTGKVPNIHYLKPFGYQVTILNTSDPLGKFDGKADEGYIVGYSAHSKAYRVYNLNAKRIEETLNLRYLEDKPNVQGQGHAWYFYLDYLTDYLGYTRFVANQSAGTQESPSNNAGVLDDDSEDESVFDEPLLYLHFLLTNLQPPPSPISPRPPTPPISIAPDEQVLEVEETLQSLGTQANVSSPKVVESSKQKETIQFKRKRSRQYLSKVSHVDDAPKKNADESLVAKHVTVEAHTSVETLFTADEEHMVSSSTDPSVPAHTSHEDTDATPYTRRSADTPIASGKAKVVEEDIPSKKRTRRQMEEDRLGEEAKKLLHDDQQSDLARIHEIKV
ncbi:ribonuclease H-like domain-containing protein [Artemisia annua]|uniref:Ribonuclease H-like domain-containing protein n=1 Tax=Artemisia annua TaxID=35608 RepID=A0A2U1LJW0_ARTAN|nr:ribonuclease H-like domain-containing protein [Artemisia annua]